MQAEAVAYNVNPSHQTKFNKCMNRHLCSITQHPLHVFICCLGVCGLGRALACDTERLCCREKGDSQTDGHAALTVGSLFASVATATVMLRMVKAWRRWWWLLRDSWTVRVAVRSKCLATESEKKTPKRKHLVDLQRLRPGPQPLQATHTAPT